MQRIEIKFTEKEWTIMEKWLKGINTGSREFKKEFNCLFGNTEVEIEIVFLNIKDGIRVSFDTTDGRDWGIPQIEDYIFKNVDDLIGIYNLMSFDTIVNESNIYVSFEREYKEGGYFSNYKKYKKQYLKQILSFTEKKSIKKLNNVITYLNFEDEEEFSLAMHTYINYMYKYGREYGIEYLIKLKLNKVEEGKNFLLNQCATIFKKAYLK